MNDKLNNLPRQKRDEPRKVFGFEDARKEMEFLGQQISKLGENEKLLEIWNKFSKLESIEKGKQTLSFLEKLEFQSEENIEAWRKAIFGISNIVKINIPGISKEDVDKLIQEELANDISSKKELENATLKEKMEFVEDEIRRLHSQRQQKRSEEEVQNSIASIIVLRRIRDRLYQDNFQV